ncbi:MAG: tRNA (guanine(26)-N(2))-dimethyltransferase [Thermococcus sp.]|uniref:tRNA (guanine(10)-N(2))-dimethyltransferase n=1 Tax=Thermococcus sp. TaxID=35749 RepID=UPI001DD37D4A|nr:tRNA (guanine(10)-N(2))-dimethyltransferase [Thermococcus sp.]MBO8173667.1 tRNA (guanine(26)-N(2))-dimethyltransferase [Thermococcus sp.]
MELIEISEGKARVLVPKAERIYDAPVFYNPVMALNRDLSVLLLKVVKAKRVLDALSATGIRGIRYALETPATEVWMNDINPDAFELIIKNLGLNFSGKIEIHEKKAILKGNKVLVATNLDANRLMNEQFRYFDFIDLDPFGSPMEFLDSALRSVKRKGVLAITATDTAPLCGAHPKACLRKYNAVPIRGELCHEAGLRILIGTVARYVAKYDMGFEVLFAYYKDHYFRAFLRFKDGAKKGDETLEKLGYLYFNENNGKFGIERSFLPSKPKAYGPLWLGELKNQEIVEEMHKLAEKEEIAKKKKVLKFLGIIKEELDVPFFYDTHALARRNNLEARKVAKIIEILEEEGYKATRTHFSPTALKTNAPFEEVLEALKSLQ